MTSRLALLASLVLALVACGSGTRTVEMPPLPRLATNTVQAAAVDGGRAWDGVVEAVQQAELTAQTAGRVTVVAVDVKDRPAAEGTAGSKRAAEMDAAEQFLKREGIRQ